MRLLAVLLTFLTAASCAGNAPSEPSVTPDVAITIDATRLRQSIEDVSGGNFAHTFAEVETGLDAVGRLNFEGLAPRHLRLRMALEEWEPVNDDGNPDRAAAGRFRDEGHNHGAFLLAQEAAMRGFGLTASIWDVPDWMVSTPGISRNRKIRPSLYSELAESIAEWLLTARTYGAEVDYLSFNEADVGVNVSLTPAEHASLVAALGPSLAARGLRARWLLGDCSNIADCAAYARPIWESAAARPYLGAFAFHTWDVSSRDDGVLSALAEFGSSTGLPIRATEAGYDTRLWQRPEEFPTWAHALRLATTYVRILKWTGASVIQYWQMLGFDYNLNDGRSGYPAYQVLRSLREQLPPGSAVVETGGGDGVVHSLAARASGDFVLFLVNTASVERHVGVAGLPGGRYRQVRSSAAAVGQELPPITGGSQLTLTLAAQSLTLLTSRR